MKRTLKRESKVLEIVKKETIEFSEMDYNMLVSDKKLIDFFVVFSHYQLFGSEKGCQKVGRGMLTYIFCCYNWWFL
jgi:hypothetical protein